MSQRLKSTGDKKARSVNLKHMTSYVLVKTELPQSKEACTCVPVEMSLLV